MRFAPLIRSTIVAGLLLGGLPVAAPCATPATPDTLQFEPVADPEDLPPDSEEPLPEAAEAEPLHRAPFVSDPGWLQPPFRAPLSGRPASDERLAPGTSRTRPVLDYNRVDELRLGFKYQAQARWRMSPRLGLRTEYATARRRWLYGAWIEQPLDPAGLAAAGFGIGRSTSHAELQQVGDLENSLVLLFGRQDYRDYFEREGLDGYLALRVPGMTTFSAHGRNERYRSLETFHSTRSLFHGSRRLRDNPPIQEGEAHVFALRLERVRPGRTGFHHWLDYETAGDQLGGDFTYRRLLADLRNVSRLSPSTTFALRAVAGSRLGGELPPQRSFSIGGADGLRAHSFAAFRGDQVAMGQIEYSAGVGRFGSGRFENGLYAIVFLDAGTAWSDPDWNVGKQRFALDGGFGLATAEDNVRIYFARNLQDPDSDVVISARLRRPF